MRPAADRTPPSQHDRIGSPSFGSLARALVYTTTQRLRSSRAVGELSFEGPIPLRGQGLGTGRRDGEGIITAALGMHFPAGRDSERRVQVKSTCHLVLATQSGFRSLLSRGRRPNENTARKPFWHAGDEKETRRSPEIVGALEPDSVLCLSQPPHDPPCFSAWDNAPPSLRGQGGGERLGGSATPGCACPAAS